MDPLLVQLIDIAAKELEKENNIWLEAVSDNSAYKGEYGGLSRINNERYYQFVIARGLTENFPHRIGIEKEDNYDLVVYEGSTNDCKVIVEMKRWMTPTGEGKELERIKDDVVKLQSSKGKQTLLMIFSADNPDKTDGNIIFLTKKLNLSDSNLHWKGFKSTDTEGKDITFWVAGYQIS